ncbi:hemerythrin domain-containing protein [Actinokineospora sp. NBRC 105648]|uniref:hemerythrin domain-containing protein n=1 Tax=Actinokineospora sp. NBRC 105648 TaxID=3032206 RepID=UPI0024A17FFA|nr:hemerythrin domain-containing protein [Actinokineospora sp. NBRC 105648]GLZ42044.1 hypothetical protein Acsp05_56680 [Actinokineospora sp. NBRC 105648]
MTAARMTELDLLPFLRAHECFRRDFTRLHDLVTRGAPPPRVVRALVEHWENLSAVLVHHHENEDAVILPRVHARFPAAAVRELTAEHERLDDLLGQVGPALVAAGRDHAEAARVVGAARALLVAHLDAEERVLVPLFAECFTAAEWAEMEARTTRDLEAAGLFPFLLPWITEGFDDAVLAGTLSGFPAEAGERFHTSWRRDYERRCALLWADA